MIGDRAEEIVYRWLKQTLGPSISETVDWLAQRGETPGWDIQYVDKKGARIAIEVKGTTQSRFGSIEITENEWNAAKNEGEKYALALVGSVYSLEPHISLIWDPYGRFLANELAAEPTGWRISNVGGDEASC